MDAAHTRAKAGAHGENIDHAPHILQSLFPVHSRNAKRVASAVLTGGSMESVGVGASPRSSGRASSQSSALSGGGNHSNTPPQNLHSSLRPDGNPENFDPVADRLTGGEDWFEATVYLQWEPAKLDALALHLDTVKESVADGTGDGWTQSLPGSSGLWKVEPTGARLGGVTGPIMRWRFARDGIVFLLTKRDKPHKTLPSGQVRITGDILIAHGDAQPLWKQIVEWFRELGAEVVTAKLGRVDMCVDIPGVDVHDFVEMYHVGRYTTRTKRTREHCKHLEANHAQPTTLDDDASDEDSPWVDTELYRSGRRYTGLRFGKGTQLRIYDKLAECRDLALRAWLAHRRWGGVVPEAATRVEFQLRRSFLTAEKVKPLDLSEEIAKVQADIQEQGETPELMARLANFREHHRTIGRPVIDTVQDYFEHRAELARYLVSSWVCFWEEGFNPRHPERAKVAEVWKRVAADFAAWTGQAQNKRFVAIQREEMPVEDLMKQAMGCIESAAARCGLVIEDDPDQDEPSAALWTFVADQLWPLVEEARGETPERVRRKMKALIRPLSEADLIPI